MRSSAESLGNVSPCPNPGWSGLSHPRRVAASSLSNAIPAADFRFMLQEFGTYNPIKVLHPTRGKPLAPLRLSHSRASHQTGVEKCILPREQEMAETRP